MRRHSFLTRSLLTVLCTAANVGQAAADMLSTWFPDGVPGYDTAPGVTITSRLHPEQRPLGLRAGTFQLWPRLDESIGYTSNIPSGPQRQGSWQVVTEPALAINSDWSRNAFGSVLSAQNMRYLSASSQDWTNATASDGGRIDLGGGQFTLAASHLALHEGRSQIDTIPSDRPIAFQID